MQKLFCWPCLLFSVEISVWNKNGFDDLNNLSKARKRHENSKCHIDSFVKLQQFGNQNRMESNISEQYKINIENYNKKVTANRYIISKLIDVVRFLSKQELAFRGHRKSTESNNRGNYIELVYLLSTSDNQLKLHLEKSTVFTGLSNRIQNDLLKSLGNILLREIKKGLENATFVAIIVDETTDISHRAQMSTVFRYMIENGNVEERFVGFTDVSKNREEIRYLLTYLTNFSALKN
ncbi:hypothetical protein ILUMI_14785 [Ignelater luminosus]|uniref:DUF4371 domain-containing protein n=1 Tax=Ignelater luminosus TaxID=2038154 RepID=A0A8K0GAL1_IGNLU|nr:hypothetical protein ILUMI_14785 [Ignelater luminosus]